jgi:hypothetical protein
MNPIRNSIAIIDNAIPNELHDIIERNISAHNFPWYYNDNVSGVFSAKEREEVGFVNVVFRHKVDNKSCLLKDMKDYSNNILISSLRITADKINVPVTNINRIRVGMFLKSPLRIIHQPHTDYNVPHLSMLYYLIDSDGPTYFYDEKGDVIKTVDPVKGTAVIFDGSIKHSSSTPVNSNRRIVINYNFNFYET